MTREQQVLSRSATAQIVLVGVTAFVAVLGFRAAFSDWSFALPAAIGAAGATGIVLLSAWRRLLIGETIALSTVAMLIFGAVAVGGLPTPNSFTTLFEGLRSGWADILTLTPPTTLTGELVALPFVLAWFGATVGCELSRRTSIPGLPMVGPLIALVVSVLVTGENRSVGLTQGALLATIALTIGLLQWLRSTDGGERALDVDRDDQSTATRAVVGSTVRVVAALALIAGLAPFVGPRLPFAEANERFDLRDRNEPPWDPLQVSSPLAQVKSYLLAERAEDRLFTVASEQSPTRFSLAVLGDFDGSVWTAGSTTGASAVTEFRPVGNVLPTATDAGAIVDGPADTELTITIDALRGPFIPLVGVPATIEVSDAVSADPAFRMNLVTGTIASPAGLRTGQTISMSVSDDPAPAPTVLATADLAPVPAIEDSDIVPLAIRNLAADLVEGVDVGWGQVEALRDRFVDTGFYDTSAAALPGHSYFGLARFLDDPDRIVGYEEQYAAAAALVGRVADIPTRVVVGFLIPESRYVDGAADVLAPDITAWIEVDVAEVGWVVVDVAPDRSREPTAEAQGRTFEDVAIPSPPPPPPIPPTPDILASEDKEPEDEEDEEEEEEEAEVPAESGVATGVLVAGGVASALILAVLVGAVIAVVKTTRRRRRRRHDDAAVSVAMAWRETLDRYEEAGVAFSSRATPNEAVRTVTAHGDLGAAGTEHLEDLAGIVAKSAFHPQPPEASDAAGAWNYYDGVSRSVSEESSVLQRVRMAANPRTLRKQGWSRAVSERRSNSSKASTDEESLV